MEFGNGTINVTRLKLENEVEFSEAEVVEAEKM